MSYIPEEWKPVVGFEGYYEVSSEGRVRRTSDSGGAKVGRVLRFGNTLQGYRQVNLSKAGRARMKYVHHLVAEAFIGPRPTAHVINHRDGVKVNNLPSNLEYVSPRQNVDHALDHGLFQVGERHHSAKVTDDMVRNIRRMSDTLSCVAIARVVGVSKSTVWLIATRKAWKHVA